MFYVFNLIKNLLVGWLKSLHSLLNPFSIGFCLKENQKNQLALQSARTRDKLEHAGPKLAYAGDLQGSG